MTPLRPGFSQISALPEPQEVHQAVQKVIVHLFESKVIVPHVRLEVRKIARQYQNLPLRLPNINLRMVRMVCFVSKSKERNKKQSSKGGGEDGS